LKKGSRGRISKKIVHKKRKRTCDKEEGNDKKEFQWINKRNCEESFFQKPPKGNHKRNTSVQLGKPAGEGRKRMEKSNNNKN